ncbi:MAG: FtsX-like permease family protein [Eubacteriales bacterium]|nr:FtsX-like permease family protein [Eubacteriales bacterium]
MGKSGNKKVIKNIVQRNLQSEKRRNVMLVIAIALASFLICFSGLIATSLMEIQKRQIQDTYEAVYMNVSEEKLLKLKEETGFERIGQYYIVGDISSDKKFTATFFYMDQSMLYIMRNQINLSSGEIPDAENQIAVCRKWLDKYGLNKNVGDKITLDTEELSGEYMISGILDMRISGETFPFLISEKKLKNYDGYDDNLNMVYVHVKKKNVEEIKEYCSAIAEKNNLSVAFNNQYFRYINQIISVEQVGILSVLIILVLIGSYTVIKSIFQISIISNIQNYGQLRTIGATQNEIRKIVGKEGRYLGVRGIIFGIILAIVCSIIILTKGVNIINYIVCTIITVAICSIAVRISINTPVKIAMKASPVEAVRVVTTDNFKIAAHKNNRKLTPISLGIMNFRREPKKVWSIVISLSLGGIILLAVSSALLLQSPERMAQHYFGNVDYKIYIDSDKDHTRLLYLGNPLNENLRQEIYKISGVKKIQALRKSATFTFQDEGKDVRGMCDMITEKNRKEIEESLIAGKMPEDTKEILVKTGYQDFGEEVKIGMQFEISFGREKIPVKVSGIFQSSKAPVSEGNGRGGFDAAMMYMSEEAFIKLLPKIKNYDYTWGIITDLKRKNDIGEKLRNIAIKNGDISVESFMERKENYRTANTIYFILQVVSVLIFLFGLINLINTTLANQLFRRHEYSTLRSIGLTEKQLYKVVVAEGLCYSICSICVTLLIGTPVAMLIHHQISIGCYGKVVDYSFPFFYMGIYVLALFLIQIILSIYQIKIQKKHTIIDQLRIE